MVILSSHELTEERNPDEERRVIAYLHGVRQERVVFNRRSLYENVPEIETSIQMAQVKSGTDLNN